MFGHEFTGESSRWRAVALTGKEAGGRGEVAANVLYGSESALRLVRKAHTAI